MILQCRYRSGSRQRQLDAHRPGRMMAGGDCRRRPRHSKDAKEIVVKIYVKAQALRVWFGLLALAGAALVLGAGQRWHL